MQGTYLPDSAFRLYTAVLRIRARDSGAVPYCSMESDVSCDEGQRANREQLDHSVKPLCCRCHYVGKCRNDCCLRP